MARRFLFSLFVWGLLREKKSPGGSLTILISVIHHHPGSDAGSQLRINHKKVRF
jgi:hypothetical protein